MQQAKNSVISIFKAIIITKMQNKDTIYALSTCYGKSGIAVIRISGPESLRVLKDFHFKYSVKPKVATLGKIYDNITFEVIDEIIVIYFSKEHSYTGDDIVELQVHGSIAVIKAILSKLNSFNYLRLANNGEFTRMALENNRISLTRAESLIELINSETECQRKIAIRHYDGGLENVYSDWRKEIIKLASIAEAYIDFPEDISSTAELKRLNEGINSLWYKLQKSIKSFKEANTLMNGVYVSIVGVTNVGKSTLMNIISKTDTSIVSNIKGTTRDIVKAKIEILGMPVIVQDTAGIRPTSNEIENIGIEKSKKAIVDGDIIIVMLDILDLSDLSIFLEIKKLVNKESYIIVLLNKIDKVQSYKKFEIDIIKYLKKINFVFKQFISVSLKTQKDHSKIIKLIESSIKDFAPITNTHLITNIRHQNSLKNCSNYLQRALKTNTLELKAEELRFATKEIGGILGEIDVETILDEIFSSFCIGK